MEEKVTEQVIQIMVQNWEMPEEMVRQFMVGLVGNPASAGLESLREAAANLLQDIILQDEK